MSMNKVMTALAVTTALGVSTVLGANPFTDITPQDWSYQAVVQLAKQGVVNGYPDGTFQGGHNITRFEMAQMVAKALQQQERMNGEQQEVLNKLRGEFSEELRNLGVRVENLEHKVGNVSFTGDIRLRFDGQKEHGLYVNVPTDNTILKVNGKNVTFNKGMHEVHFSEEGIDAARRLTMQTDLDALRNSVDKSESATALAEGIYVEEADIGSVYHNNSMGLVAGYEDDKKLLSDDEKHFYSETEKRIKIITRKYTHTPEGMGFTFDLPDSMTTHDAVKLAYDKWKKAKAEFIKQYPDAKDDSSLAIDDFNIIFTYYFYHKASILPEYIYYLSQQYGINGKKKSATSYRVRVNAMADVNKNTKIGIRLAQESEFGTGAQKKTEVDRLWISHRFGKSQVVAGRVGAMFGDGLVFEGDFDGIVGGTKLGATNLTVGYGYPTELTTNAKDMGQTMVYGQLQAPITKHISGKVYMASLNSHTTAKDGVENVLMGSHVGLSHRVYGVALSGDHGRFGWNAEYAKRTVGEDNQMFSPVLRSGKGRNAWMAGVNYTYGKATVGLQYFYLGQNSPILASSVYDTRYSKNWKGYVATLNYAFNQHASAKVGYAFKGTPVEMYHGAVAPASKYFAQVEYKF